MWKHRSKFVVPLMVVVAVMSTLMLQNFYTEVPTKDKIVLVIAATLFSGLITAILFPKEDDEHKIDPKK